MVQAESRYSVDDTQTNLLQRLAGDVPNPSHDTSTSSEGKVVNDAGNTKQGIERQRNEDEATRVINDQDTDTESYYVITKHEGQQQQYDDATVTYPTNSEADNKDKKKSEENPLNTQQEEYSTGKMEKMSEMVTDDDDDDGTPDGGWGYVVVLGTFIIVVCVYTMNTCVQFCMYDMNNRKQ